MFESEEVFSLPFIALSTTLSKKDHIRKITRSKIGGMPYIDNQNKHLARSGEPLNFLLQLNMDQIFNELLKGKKSDKVINKYLSMYPHTGIIQIYAYGEYNENFVVHYLKTYDKDLHIEKLSKGFIDQNGIFHTDHNLYENDIAYITHAVYGYNRIEKTGDHPYYLNDMKHLEDVHLSKFYEQENDGNSLHIAGFPFFLQDGEFDTDDNCMLFQLTNSILGLNIIMKKKHLKKMRFDKAWGDLSY